MKLGKANDISRRTLLRRATHLSAFGSLSAIGFDLAGISDAAAQSADDDYKALVCVFLLGGNDNSNTLIPVDAQNYARYAQIRPTVALPFESLGQTILRHPEEQVLTDDLSFALAPTMPRLKSYFDQESLAVLLNVGPLVAPITKAQFLGGDTRRYPRPQKLFSHNDQQAAWQSSSSSDALQGWGGRLGDIVQSSNTNTMFTAINASGNALFLSGDMVQPFTVSPRGATEAEAIVRGNFYGSSLASQVLRELATTQNGHVLEHDYATMVARSLESSSFVNDALENAPNLATFPSGNSLASQLQIVARLISARGNLGVKRQVFMVSIGGFDHHDGLLGSHEGLLAQVDEALYAFHQSVDQLGLSRQVTSFTASDFGRTLTSNGNGTEHGWGSHHFILGGDVFGGRYFGKAPRISINSDDEIGSGRFVPTTSVDEYSATLASWLGVPNSMLADIAPNLGRFGTTNLGFMRPSG